MSYNLDERDKDNVQSPLTKQLLDKIEEEFINNINKMNFESSIKNSIIELYRRTAKMTTDKFIIDLLTEAVSKNHKKRTRGRRRTDGL